MSLDRSQDISAALRRGPQTSAALCRLLEMSQPTLSRRITALGDSVLSMGKARAVRYFARRSIGGQNEFSLFRVTSSGKLVEWGTLYPVCPGFVMKFADQSVDQHFEGLPWWLQDMRPQGFLGRAWARQHAGTFGISTDLLQWSDDDAILVRAAGHHDAIGDLLIGSTSRGQWLAHQLKTVTPERYPALAQQALSGEVAGSSAGGEQPKFTASIEIENRSCQSSIVKFSADIDNAISERWRDLLLAEHLALSVLNEHGFPASQSRIVDIGRQRFLELERFDRVGILGRRGVVSLAALNGAFIGHAEQIWPQLTAKLLALKVITASAHERTSYLYAFGVLIGNSDMHHGNLSFFYEGALPLSLAPAYDMLPMAFAPDRNGTMRNELSPFILPAAPGIQVWQAVLPMAQEYWQKLSADPRCSKAFSIIAAAQLTWLQTVSEQLKRAE